MATSSLVLRSRLRHPVQCDGLRGPERADQVDVPAPLPGARVAARGERDDALGDVAQALQLGRVSAALSVMISVHNSVCCWPIATYGTDEQKARFLPLLTAGTIGAFLPRDLVDRQRGY